MPRAPIGYPRPFQRTVGLSMRLSRIVLGLSQQQAGELLGISRNYAKVRFLAYESTTSRPRPERIPAIESLLERACVYAAQRFGGTQSEARLPDSHDREYALKLFKYWQEHDGSRAGLRRLIPYLAASDMPKRATNPLPPPRKQRTA